MATTRGGDTQRLVQGIQAGMRSPGRNGVGSNDFGGFAAFMGLPNLAGGANRNGQYGGMQGIMQRMAAQNGQKPPGTGGNGAGTNGNDPSKPPEDPLLKAGFTPWYVDWLRSSGQTGTWAKPPGLLG